MIKINKAQQQALLKKFKQAPSGFASYRAFRKSIHAQLFGDTSIMVEWCGMWLGIETDGYTHS